MIVTACHDGRETTAAIGYIIVLFHRSSMHNQVAHMLFMHIRVFNVMAKVTYVSCTVA